MRRSLVQVSIVAAVLFPLASAAQATQPSVVLAELKFAPQPDFTKSDGKRSTVAAALEGDFFSILERQSGITVPSRRLTEHYVQQSLRRDWAEADDALVALAGVASTRYAMFAFVSLASDASGAQPPQEGLGINLLARVVGTDGRVARRLIVFKPRHKESLRETFRAAAEELFSRLELAKLPATLASSEGARAGATPPVLSVTPGASQAVPPPAPTPAFGLAPPPLPPPEVTQQAGVPGVWRPLGYATLGVGAAAVVAGAVVLAVAPKVHLDANGFVPGNELSTALAARRQQQAGVGLLAAGAVVAVAGGFMAFWLPEHRLHAAAVPTGGGALLSLGGDF